jgi:hypothetical protein
MDAFARHYVGQGNTRGEHSYAHFTMFGLGPLFFNHPKCFGPAVVSDDDARVSHGAGAWRKLANTRQSGDTDPASTQIHGAQKGTRGT